jgi:hypothetical protein
MLISFHPEMALFPMSCVLRGFSAYDVLDVRFGENPCAALLIEKIAHFQIGNYSVLSPETKSYSHGHEKNLPPFA